MSHNRYSIKHSLLSLSFVMLISIVAYAATEADPISYNSKSNTVAVEYVSNGTGGGNWFTPSTWLIAGVPATVAPTAADNVTIASGDVVTATNGTLLFDNLTIDGTLSSTNVNVTLAGSIITNNGTLTFSHTGGGIPTFKLNTNLTNEGTINWQGGHFNTDTDAVITNNADYNISPAGNLNSNNIDVTNSGTGTVTHTSTIQTLHGEWTNMAGGQINIDAGIMQFIDIVNNEGDIDVTGDLRLEGASLNFTGGDLDGTGTLGFVGANEITAPNGITVGVDNISHFNNTSVTGIGNPEMTIGTGSTWNALNANFTIGSFSDIVNDGTIDINHTAGGFSTIKLNSDVTNNGTLNWLGVARLNTDEDATITNNGNYNISSSNSNTNNINVINSGTVTHTSAEQSFLGDWTNQSGGALNIDAGIMTMLSNSLTNDGDIDVTGELRLQENSLVFNAGTLDGTGLLRFNLANNIEAPNDITIDVDNISHFNNASVTGINNPELTIATGSTWNALNANFTIGSFSDIVNDGTIDINHTASGFASTFKLNSDVTNNGTLNWLGANFNTDEDVTLTNNGNYNISPSSNLNSNNINVINSGTVTHTSAAQNFLGDWTNQSSGALNIDAGIMTMLSNSLTNDGDIDVTGELRMNTASLVFNLSLIHI